MRIHRLELRGFGPFKQPQVINFDDFSSGKFLISGKTGSGKSMLLDALCFALYGKPASDTEQAKSRLRSRLASPHESTEVAVVFSTSAGFYRIERSPAYERAALRGKGVTLEKPAARLYKLPDLNAKAVDAIATKAREVGYEMARILPLSYQQFLQTVLLPQGKFETFLTAPSNERKEVLETVFGTQIYSEFEKLIKERASSARKSVDESWQLVERAAGPHSDRLDLEQLAHSTQRARDLQSSACVSYQELFEPLQIIEAVNATRTQLLSADKQKLEATTAHNQSLQTYRQILSDYLGSDDIFTAAATAQYRLGRHEKALAVQTAENELNVTLTELASAREKLALDEQGEPLALAQLRKQLAHFAAEEKELAGQQKRLKELTKVSAELAAEQDEITAAEKATDKAQNAKLAAVAALAELEEKSPDLEALQEGLDEIKSHVALTEKIKEQWQGLAKEAAKIKQAEAKIAGLVSDHDKAKQVHEQAFSNWAADSAEILAGQLQENEACPVCGSEEHPAPADHSERAEHIDFATVIEASNAISALQARIDNEQEALRVAREQYEQLTKPDLSEEEADQKLQLLAAQTKAKQGEIEAAKAVIKKQKAAQTRLNKLSEAHEQATKDLAALQVKIAERRGRAETLRAQLAENNSEDLDLKQIASQLKEVRKEQRRIETAIEAAEIVQELSTRQQVQQRAVDTALANGEFTSTDYAKRACLSAPLVKKLSSMQVSKMERERLRGRLLEEKYRNLRHRELQPTDALSARIKNLEERLKHGNDKALELQTQLKSVAALRENLQLRIKQWRAASLDSAELIRVAELITNAASSSPLSMAISTWVLTHRLDEILQVASPRLASMSEGKFEFRRSDSDGGRTHEQALTVGIYVADLDAVVMPGSLSGGEKFMASLALALALIEVVQSEAGGVEIGTMFIDEGFGTLDQDKLATVMQQLHTESGTERTVGIISHVEELKRSIGDSIVVIKDEETSESVLEIRN